MRRRKPTTAGSGPDQRPEQRILSCQDSTEQPQQLQLHWLTLRLNSDAAELGFRDTWAHSVLLIDRWFFLLLLLLVPIWFLSEARRSSTAAAGAAAQACTSIFLPLTGLILDQCIVQKAAVWAAVFVAAARTAAILQLLLRPAGHVQRRTAIVFGTWLLDVAVRLLLGLMRCSNPQGSCRSLVVWDTCMAVIFVMYHMPFAVALPCCSLYWGACTVLHYVTNPSAALSEHAMQLLLQLLLPLGTLYVVQRRARLAYKSVLGPMQQQQQSTHASNSSSTCEMDGESSKGTATAADGVHAASGSQAASAATVQVAATGAGAQLADGPAAAASATPTASLVYESPLLHRTVAIKVHSAAAPDQEPTLMRLAATVQSAVAGLPGMSRAALGSRLCIPGCMLFLGTVTCAQQQQEEQREVQQQHEHVQHQPAMQGAAWHIDLGKGCCSAGEYSTVDKVMAAAKDGSLQAGVARAAAAVPCQESYVVSAWGSVMQLAARPLVPSSSSSSSSSKGPLQLRLVLTRGNSVVFDREQALQPPLDGRSEWRLSLQLPRSSCDGSTASNNRAGCGPTGLESSISSVGGSLQGCSVQQQLQQQGAGVLSLYMLPMQRPPQHAAASSHPSSSSPASTCPHLAAKQEPFAPLAHVSLLLLPPAAVQELASWMQHHRLTRQQLRPMLADLAVAVEAVTMACGCSTACTPGATCAACSGQVCGGWGVAAEHLELAVAAAERLARFFAACGFGSCSALARQLLQVLATAKPPWPAAAAAAVPAAAVQDCNLSALSI